MKYIKLLVFTIMLVFALALPVALQAAVITDSFHGSTSDTLMYSVPDPENPWAYDQLYFTYLDYEAEYDTDTGEGFYEYTAYGWTNITIRLEAVGGVWTQTSYYGEAFFPSFAWDFWSAVWGI